MFIKIEITPEIYVWYLENKDARSGCSFAGEMIINAIEKTKNNIQVGDIMKFIGYSPDFITFFKIDVICKSEGVYYTSMGQDFTITESIKATKEEEAIIRPILEGK